MAACSERAAAEENELPSAPITSVGVEDVVRMSTVRVTLPLAAVMTTSVTSTPAATAILEAMSFLTSSVKSLMLPAMTNELETTR